jgi:hypothetical protein
MKTLTIALTAALLAMPVAAFAESQTKITDKPGHSESAPGQRADEPGDAKNYAPGQQVKKKNDPNSPGASEYAPGHQPADQHSNIKK